MEISTESEPKIQLPPSWKEHLLDEFKQPYLAELKQFLIEEKKANKIICPKGSEYFNAFHYTPFDAVKVVLLGQDPYHGKNQAHGLSFSVRPHQAIPPSLKNIYRELKADLCLPPAKHGHLVSWAQQGILLLNSVLTVELGKPGSHQGHGWEIFTDKVIECLNAQKDHLVFLLWGSYAHKKGQFIDDQRHLVLKAAHPSPFSAHNGFFGCQHFSKTNAYLIKQGKTPINWQLPEIRI
ncbi:MAG: uracil-DNA glycosylase [Gammaproteobacteria bacterium]|nr:uracil-DNA glycosylase [Gammaproteobacteria bacterium]